MKTFIASIFILLMQPVYSQTSLFEGAYYGLSLVTGATNTTATATSGANQGLYDNNGKSMQAGRAEVGYGYFYQDEFIINVKATYDLTKPVIHTSRDSANRKDTQQSHFSVAVEPGRLIDSKTLVFGRLGIHSNKIHYFREFITAPHLGETSNATTSYTGYGIGAGIKSELSNHVVIGIDAEIVSYGRKNPYFVRSGGTISDTNSYKLTSNITSITVSKKF